MTNADYVCRDIGVRISPEIRYAESILDIFLLVLADLLTLFYLNCRHLSRDQLEYVVNVAMWLFCNSLASGLWSRTHLNRSADMLCILYWLWTLNALLFQ